jgi:hypothetical protein
MLAHEGLDGSDQVCQEGAGRIQVRERADGLFRDEEHVERV